MSTFGLERVTPVPAADGSVASVLPSNTRAQLLLNELQHESRSGRGRLQQLLLLAASLVLFVTLGLLQWSVPELVLLVVVLVVHEGGHYVAMTAFGYRDVRMFFIPLVGAAVSGSERDTAGWQRAVVALAGPVPGIVFGTLLAVAFLVSRNGLTGDAASMFIILNTFNLLPVLPLDGGHVLQETLFGRHRYVEAVFRIVAAAALLVAGLATGIFLLGVLGAFALVAARVAMKLNGITASLRGVERPDLVAPSPQTLETLELIAVQVEAAFPGPASARKVALVVGQVIDRMNPHPPGALSTILLLSAYRAAFVVALVGAVFVAAGHR